MLFVGLLWFGGPNLQSAIAQEFETPAHHADIEFIARDIAYRGGDVKDGPPLDKDPNLLGAIKQRGLELKESIDDDKTGMQAMVLHDPKANQDYIAFRGTFPNWREGAGDAIADADLSGDTGSSQYNTHRETLAKWAEKYPNSIVTGHSLGAALAQRFVSEHPEKVREVVVFNAPAIATEHGHRFARAEKQPDVTIYVGSGKVADGTLAPGYDFVSELGGQAHLPGKVVEVTALKPAGSLLAALTTNHTAWMLRGEDRENRHLTEIAYEEYEKRRQENWKEADWLVGAAQTALTGTEALAGAARDAVAATGGEIKVPLSGRIAEQGKDTANALANLAHGFARSGGGPVKPTPAMLSSGKRDCAAAIAHVDRARSRILGSISADKISQAQVYINLAADRSVGCPDARSKMDEMRGVVAASSQKVLARVRTATNSCDEAEVNGALDKIGSLRMLPQFAEVFATLVDRLERIGSGKCAGDGQAEDAEQKPQVELTPPSCQLATNEATIAKLAAAASDGNAEAAAHMASLKNVNASLSFIEGALKQSAQKYASEDLSAARSQLVSAHEKAASLGSTPSCPELSSRIANELSKIDRIEHSASTISEALRTCDAPAISSAVSSVHKTDHPAILSMLSEANAILVAYGAYSQAMTDFRAGDLESANATLEEIRSSLDNINGTNCTRLRETIHSGLVEIEGIASLSVGAREAAAGCDEKEITQWQKAVSERNHPALTETLNILQGAMQRCGVQDSEALARMTQSCKKKSEQNSAVFNYVERKEDGTYSCHWCKSGYYAKDRVCLPTKQTANKWCNNNNPGDNWYATNFKSDGTYSCQLDAKERTARADTDCRRQARNAGKVHAWVEFNTDGGYQCFHCEKGFRPSGKSCRATQKTANRMCNEHNPGSGWLAYNFRSDGRFDCKQTGRAARQAALKDCRRQHGKRLLRVEKQNGQYVCRFCQPGSFPSKGNCYVANNNRSNPQRRPNAPSRLPCNPSMANYGKCWGNPGPQKQYKCMKRSGYGPFGC